MGILRGVGRDVSVSAGRGRLSRKWEKNSSHVNERAKVKFGHSSGSTMKRRAQEKSAQRHSSLVYFVFKGPFWFSRVIGIKQNRVHADNILLIVTITIL